MTLSLTQFPRHESCRLCPLWEGASHVGIPTVWLESSLPPARETPALVVIGSNPGANEDRRGVPFAGRLMQILRDVYLGGIEVQNRATVYLTNSVRCGPYPDFPAKCLRTCFPYTSNDLVKIHAQHDRVAVLALGASASAGFAGWMTGRKHTQTSARKLNGKTLVLREPPLAFWHLSTYHPSYLWRKPSAADVVASDLEALNRWLADPRIGRPPEPLILPPGPPPADLTPYTLSSILEYPDVERPARDD